MIGAEPQVRSHLHSLCIVLGGGNKAVLATIGLRLSSGPGLSPPSGPLASIPVIPTTSSVQSCPVLPYPSFQELWASEPWKEGTV
jgi:hypothetical protein